MNFHLDSDTGTLIYGWLVPDNPSVVPSYIVEVPGQPETVFKANVLRPDIRDLGMHSTGMVGFRIDCDLIPNLGEIEALVLLEAETRLPIYRRQNRERHLDRKLLFVDATVMPQPKLSRRLLTSFALSYPMIERYSLETVNAILFNQYQSSIVVSGQLNWPRYGSMARDRGFLTAALLRDPFEELAERLQFFAYLGRRSSTNALATTFARLKPLAAVAQDIDLDDDRSIISRLRRATPEERRALRSPMTSMFGCGPDEEPQRRAVSVALDNLATFGVVGVRDQFELFGSVLAGMMDADVLRDLALEALPGTPPLAARLAHIGLVADLLDEDIALYSFTREAVSAGTAALLGEIRPSGVED